jgi:hypothetical protein
MQWWSQLSWAPFFFDRPTDLGDVWHDAAQRVELLVELAAAVALHDDVLVRRLITNRRRRWRCRRGMRPVRRARVVVGRGVFTAGVQAAATMVVSHPTLDTTLMARNGCRN